MIRICQLDGCDKSIEHKRSDAKYCCEAHKVKYHNQTPEAKARRRAYQQTPEAKEKARAYSQTPEYKAGDRARRQSPYMKAYMRAYMKDYDQSPEVKAKKRAYSQTPERKASLKAYNQNSKRKAYLKAYHQTPERKAYMRAYVHKRNAHKRAIPATYTVEDWINCLEYWGHKCAYCGADGALHQEHFIPFSQGGAYTPDNIIPACPGCNSSKHDKDPQDFLSDRPEVYDRIIEYLGEQ